MKEAISVFDIFKIGIGPSSSHTLGPWRAAQRFVSDLKQRNILSRVTSLNIFLYGSLAKTGKGHGTDIALQLGLTGYDPATFPTQHLEEQISGIATAKKIRVLGWREMNFDPGKNIQFLVNESLPYHPNAVKFVIELDNGEQSSETYYSVGGGFIQKENEPIKETEDMPLPFPIEKADDLLHWCRSTGKKVSEVVKDNESRWRPDAKTRLGLLKIWKVMKECIYRGCHAQGILPGGLNVKRRAFDLNEKLLNGKSYCNYEDWIKAIRAGGDSFEYTIDWVSCFALAVNEENASFGRVVTAPTNGAAGVIPAVLQYSLLFYNSVSENSIIQFLLTASEIGSIFKKGATISAAMGGCQAEIGVSSAMAAAGLTEVLGGSPEQVLMAAEIAMEHHLGLTCDPVGGLVQIPCIERNTMGAIKAITAARLALQSSPEHAKVSLDHVIKTMWSTALDMSSKYKETADGGLAVAIPMSLPEC